MALKFKSKILLAKIETAYGVDPTPTGADNGILATDITITPMEGQDLSRNLELPYLGGQATIPVDLHAKMTFKVELVGSGTAGTAPAWGPLLRACGCAQVITESVSVEYTPITDAHESIAVHLWIAGTRFVLLGSRGNAKLNWTASNIPYLEFEITGLFTVPTEVIRAAPTLTGFKNPVPVNSARTPTFTINDVSLVMRSFALNMGNDVQGRFLVKSESIIIVDRQDAIETTVEAVPVSTFDPFTLAVNQTAVEIALVHGTAAGFITTLDIPKAQAQRPQGLENAQNIVEWPLRFAALPTDGNDQWSLTLT